MPKAWHVIQTGIVKACKRTGSRITPDRLYTKAITGQALYGIFSEDDSPTAAIILNFSTWGDKRVLYVLALVNNHSVFDEIVDETRIFAKVHGADAIAFDGTKGYTKTMPKAKAISSTYLEDL